jgi:hypothetical protein
MCKIDKQKFHIVIEVKSGIPVLAEAYRNKKKAFEREKTLRKKMHPENDETGVFEVEIK